MKTSTAMMALVVGLSAPAAAEAQFFRNGGSNPRSVPAPPPKPTSAPAAGAAPGDPSVKPSGFVVPEPINADDRPPPGVKLPAEPIEPFLLTREAGPFMVNAHAFKGPHADQYAQILAMELRSKYGLPAYVLRPKDFPLRSNIRGVPPTANPGINRAMPGLPLMERIKDEALVLVGNEKTLADSKKLLNHVKKIRPECLDVIPECFPWRKGKGLKYATNATNPYVPAEELFPRQPDLLVQRINQGPHSIYTCPGRYSLQIAEFSGRQEMVQGPQSENRLSVFSLKSSPLATAGDDAEKLAEKLAKDPLVRQTGYVPYVYHDRYSSKVYIGAFNSETDPEAAKLRKNMINLSLELNTQKITDVAIVPATALTDLGGIKMR